MLIYLLRRLLYGFPILVATTLILFIILNVVPGDPALQMAGKHATPEVIATIRAEYGLDKPLPIQYLNLLKGIFTLDFGRSFSTKEKITEKILNGAGASLSLVLPPFLLSTLMSILIGMILAYYRGSFIDRSVTAIAVGMQSVSVLVYILFGQYFLAYKAELFPISGYDTTFTGRWAYLMLPGLIYILLSLAPNIRFYRTIILDELYQDYVRTARSKGLSDKVVMARHILKNAMIPILTNLVISLPYLILGALLLESFFSIPGLGSLIVDAARLPDFPVLSATTVMLTVGYILFNILTDVMYSLSDPRVKLQ